MSRAVGGCGIRLTRGLSSAGLGGVIYRSGVFSLLLVRVGPFLQVRVFSLVIF